MLLVLKVLKDIRVLMVHRELQELREPLVQQRYQVILSLIHI